MKTTAERVKEIIVDQLLMVDEEQVTPEATLVDDLGADSLDMVEVVMNVEEEFDLEVPGDDAEKWKTVQDVVDYVVSKVK